MSRLPDIEWVDELPVAHERDNKLFQGWVSYVLGRLMERPGQWARVVTPKPPNVTNVLQSCKRAGIEAEAVMRQSQLYMRVTGVE